MTPLARYLRQFRQERGWTIREAADKARLSIAYLSDIERGRTLPALATLERILAIYSYRLTIVATAINEAFPDRFPALLDPM